MGKEARKEPLGPQGLARRAFVRAWVALDQRGAWSEAELAKLRALAETARMSRRELAEWLHALAKGRRPPPARNPRAKSKAKPRARLRTVERTVTQKNVMRSNPRRRPAGFVVARRGRGGALEYYDGLSFTRRRAARAVYASMELAQAAARRCGVRCVVAQAADSGRRISEFLAKKK